MADMKLALILEAKAEQFKRAIAEARGEVDKLGAGSKSASSGIDATGKAASGAAAGLKSTAGAANDAAFGVARVGKSSNGAAGSLDKAGKSAGDAAQSIERLGQQSTPMQGLALAAGKLVAAFAVVDFAKSFIQTADAMTQLDGKIKLATSSAASFAIVKKQLLQIADQTGVSVEDAGAAFSRLSQSVKEAGGNTSDTLNIVKAFGLAAKISGASSQEASNAMIQLAQGMAAGVLRGDELNSVLEAAPRFAKALADSMVVSVGALKALGAEGKITAQDIMKVSGQMQVLEQEAAQMGNTVGGAIQRLQNAFAAWVGEANTGVGVTSGLSGMIDSLAKNFSSFAQILKPITTTVGAVFNIIGKLGTVLEGISGGAAGAGTVFAIIGTALIGLTGPIGAAIAGFTRIYIVLERIQGWMGADKLREAATEGERLKTIFDGFVPLMNQLNNAGLYGLTEKIGQIQNAAIQAGGDGKAAVAATEQYVQKVIAEHTKLQQTKEQLDKLYAQRAKIIAGEVAQTEKERIDQQIQDLQRLKQAKENELNASLQALQRYQQAASAAYGRAADAQISTADKIRELRRRDMSESERQADIQKQAYEKISAAAKKLQEAQTLASQGNVEGAEKAAQAAQKLAQRGEDLGSSLQDTRKGIEIVGKAGDILAKSEQAVGRANDMMAQKTAQTAEELKKTIGDLGERLKELETAAKVVEIDANISKLEAERQKAQEALDSLMQKTPVQILAESAQAMGEISNVQRELAALKDKTVTVTVVTKKVEAHQIGGPVGGVLHLNRGGRLPGYGGGDKISALLEAGEYVIRKERARRFGALVHMINTAPLSRLKALLAGFGAGVQKFAVGGPVLPSMPLLPSLSGGAGNVGTADSMDLNFNIGTNRYTVQTSRDQAVGLARALRELTRG